MKRDDDDRPPPISFRISNKLRKTSSGRSPPKPTSSGRSPPKPTSSGRSPPKPTSSGRSPPKPTSSGRSPPKPTSSGRSPPKPTSSGRSPPKPPVEPPVPVKPEEIDKIPRCFREMTLKPREIGNRRRFYGVTVYWDFENSQLPSGYPARKLKISIVTALRTFHPDFYLYKLIAIGNTTLLPLDFLTMYKEEFHFTDVVPRERICKKCKPQLAGSVVRKTDEAVSLLKEEMLFNAFDTRPPGNMLVITGDKDFASVITGLKQRGFTMMLAHPELWGRELMGCPHLYWKWTDLINGKPSY